MRLRPVLLAAVLGILAAVVAALVLAIVQILETSARERLREDVVRSRQVFEDLWRFRQVLYKAQSHVIAEEPRLKALVSTQKLGHETILGVARELSHPMDLDLLLLVDAEGYLLADVRHPEDHGADLSEMPIVRQALEEGNAAGILAEGDRLFHVHARELAFGRTSAGVLVIGKQIGDELAQVVKEHTGSPTVILLDDHVVASSLADHPSASVGSAMNALGTTSEPLEVSLGQRRYLAAVADLDGFHGDGQLRFAVMRSFDRALKPSRELQATVYSIAGGGLAIAAILAVVLAGRLSRPFRDLVDFTTRLSGGDLAARTSVGGLEETRLLGEAMNRMAAELEESRETFATNERLEREMEIATHLQTAVLPRHLVARRLEIAARMIPATEVGGDYYDVLPSGDGACWLGIGDVAGHGMPAGVVMLMIQTAVSTLVRNDPAQSPREALVKLNKILYENIRHRLSSDEHVTLCLLRHDGHGGFTHAGAHEDILVYRAGTKTVEQIPTNGAWLGFDRDVEPMTVQSHFELQPGDLMVLLTDGFTEAMNGHGELFDISGVRRAFERSASSGASVEAVRDAIVEAATSWMAEQQDDMTLLVLRYGAEGRSPGDDFEAESFSGTFPFPSR